MTLIENPSEVFITLISVVGLVSFLSTRPALKWFFKYIPSVLLVYFIPTLLTTFGVLPAESEFYVWTMKFIMPMALLLLVMTIDVPSILRIGPKALFVMLCGTVGVIVGGCVSMFLFRGYLAPEAWRGLAALSGSWIGGVGNFAAIAASLEAPADVVSPAVIVDTVVGYGWMTLVLFLSNYQSVFNRWNNADDSMVMEVKERLKSLNQQISHIPTLSEMLMILAIGFGGGYLLFNVGGQMIPAIGKTISHGMWGIILIMAVGVVLSFTPIRRLEGAGATKIGNVALFVLLSTIGAQGDLRAIFQTPIYLLLGVTWLMVHSIFLLIGARIVRAPLFFVAIGSEANIGGSVSTPIVAEAYEEHMAPAGLLLALCGTLIGTYGGIFCGLLMKWIQHGF